MMRQDANSISVVVPCHNDGAHIGEALESVFAQTRSVDEVIVVDDGSSDETAEVVRRLEKVHYVAQPHQGIGRARNIGLNLASGGYVAFLDADDVWPTNSLDIRARLLDAGSDAAMGLTEEFISPEFHDARMSARLTRGQVAVRLAGAMLVRRRAFNEIGGFDETLRVGEWIEWIDRFANAGLKIMSAPALVLRRRIHGGNASDLEQAFTRNYLAVLRASLRRKAATADWQS